jgi:hypothetical protein
MSLKKLASKAPSMDSTLGSGQTQRTLSNNWIKNSLLNKLIIGFGKLSMISSSMTLKKCSFLLKGRKEPLPIPTKEDFFIVFSMITISTDRVVYSLNFISFWKALLSGFSFSSIYFHF